MRLAAVLLCILVSTPARATDCVEGPTHTTCSNAAFGELLDEVGHVEDERAACLKDLKLVTVERDASRARVVALEAAPPPPTNFWPGVLTGAAVAVFTFLGILFAVR